MKVNMNSIQMDNTDLKFYQLRNCGECFYSDPDKVGTGEPCCTKMTAPKSNGVYCLSRKNGKRNANN